MKKASSSSSSSSSYYYYYYSHRPIQTLFSFSLLQKRSLQISSSSGADAASPTLPPLPTITPNSSSFAVQFLVNSCGLPLKSALSASQKLHLHEYNIHKTQALLLFLKSHHFDDTQIADLIKKRPTVLHCRVEVNLKPKFEFLVANGFAGNLLPQLILSNPDLLGRSLDSSIKPSLDLLVSYLGTNEKVSAALKRCSRLLNFNGNDTVQTNIDLLIKEGLPLDRLVKLIVSQPGALFNKNDRVVHAMNAIKNLGLEPKDTEFIRALAVRLQLTDTTWKKKIELMKSLGWSEDEILFAFKRYPQILAYSGKKIRSTMDFLINTFELERESLLVYPYLLSFSVEKRIRPRFNVINALKSKNLINRDNKKFPTLLIISEKKFLENYVLRYADEVPGLLEVYLGSTKKQSKALDGRDVSSLVQWKTVV